MAWYSELARRIPPRPIPTPAGDKPPRYISPVPTPLDSGFRRSDEAGGRVNQLAGCLPAVRTAGDKPPRYIFPPSPPLWTPAFAGVTSREAGMTKGGRWHSGMLEAA